MFPLDDKVAGVLSTAQKGTDEEGGCPNKARFLRAPRSPAGHVQLIQKHTGSKITAKHKEQGSGHHLQTKLRRILPSVQHKEHCILKLCKNQSTKIYK